MKLVTHTQIIQFIGLEQTFKPKIKYYQHYIFDKLMDKYRLYGVSNENTYIFINVIDIYKYQLILWAYLYFEPWFKTWYEKQKWIM